MTDEQAWHVWQQQGKGRLTLTEAEQQRIAEITQRVQWCLQWARDHPRRRQLAEFSMVTTEDAPFLLSLIQRLTQPEA